MSAPPNPAPHGRVRMLVLHLLATGAVLLLVAALSHQGWQRQVLNLSDAGLSHIGLPVTVALSDRQGVPVVTAPDTGSGAQPFALPRPQAPVRLALSQARRTRPMRPARRTCRPRAPLLS